MVLTAQMRKSMAAFILLLCVCVSAYESEDQGERLKALWRIYMKRQGVFSPSRGGSQHQLLYCRAGIGYHLRILANGSIGGSHTPDTHCVLKVSAVRRGVVAIRGVTSALYLCMTATGTVYAAGRCSDECLFKETVEENLYNTYSSLSQPGLYLAFSHSGLIKRGTSALRQQRCAHFLPRSAP